MQQDGSAEALQDQGVMVGTVPASGGGRPGGAPLVVHVFPTFAVGGAQVRFAALANRWGPRWQHVIVALDGRFECAERLRVPHRLLGFETVPGEGLPRRLWRIGALLRGLRPDVLVTSNWGAIEWAMARHLVPGLRHLHTEDGFGPDELVAQKPRRVLTRRVVLQHSRVVLPSTVLLRIARDVWRLPPARLHFIPNGLDLGRFQPGEAPPALVVPGEGPVLGAVAALRAEKNLGRMIRAAGLLRREGLALRLLIVGDGAERPALEALATQEGLAAHTLFAGHRADPAAAYRAMDVFVLSSDTEQMPFSVLEAMASRLPVAATEVGDLRAMLAPESLPHLAARDDAALATALRPLVRDAGLRARLGAANQAKATAEYDQEMMFAAYAGLIEAGVR